ncbi:MAG: choice-of-anchor L domain-containing protein [Flavobacteriales bacterium]
MIKFYTLFVALTAACGVVAQPTLVPTSSVQSIVEDFFVGNGIFVNNVTFNGGPVDAQHFQIAAFSDANNTIGIQEGIMMTTGATYEVLAGGLSSDGTYYNPQDADVLALITDALNIGEAAVLEFDFIATGDSVAFQYVFASTEYPEFVNTAFNDQFGFFISGPGIAGPFTNGATNLAVIPGTTTSVGINSVNDQLNSQYYIASDGTITGIDGYTTVLHACIGALQIGEVYHIKLIVADMSDSALSSHVFLSGSSFEQFCNEGGANPGGIQTETCMLSTLDARVDYTLDCGTVSLTNTSAIEANVTACYYEMGDGGTTTACEANTIYTFENPGTYTVKLVYEIDGFRSAFTVDNILISDFPAATPVVVFESGTFNFTNYDGTSEIQWLLNGEIIEGANDINYTPSVGGSYSVWVNNGCPVVSPATSIVGVEETLVEASLAVYPNPSAGTSTVNIPATTEYIQIYNAMGQIVANEYVKGAQLMQISLTPGTFAVRAISSNNAILDTEVLIVR